RPCPHCGELMDLAWIDFLQLDQCEEHGVWLDPGELKRALSSAKPDSQLKSWLAGLGPQKKRRGGFYDVYSSPACEWGFDDVYASSMRLISFLCLLVAALGSARADTSAAPGRGGEPPAAWTIDYEHYVQIDHGNGVNQGSRRTRVQITPAGVSIEE